MKTRPFCFGKRKPRRGVYLSGAGGHALELTQLTFRVLLTGVIRSAKALDAKPRLCSRIPFDLVFPHRCGVNRNPAKPIRVGNSAFRRDGLTIVRTPPLRIRFRVAVRVNMPFVIAGGYE